MKKSLIVAVVVASLTVVGLQQASADWGRGGSGPGNCGGPCGAGVSQLSEADQAKFDKFFDETQGLRKEMVMKQNERMALMQSDNPDPARAAKLAGELFDLRASMQSKAQAAGIQGAGGRNCDGPGRGNYHGGRGYGGQDNN